MWERFRQFWAAIGNIWLAKDLAIWILGPTVIAAIVTPLTIWAFTPASPADLALVTVVVATIVFFVVARFVPRVVHHHSAVVQLASVEAHGACGTLGTSTLQADDNSLINAEDAELSSAVSKMFPGGFAKASGGSMIHMPGIRVLDAGGGTLRVEVPPSRDIWLQDAVLFALYGRWFAADERAFPNPRDMERGTKVALHMREMAGNGDFLIWGKESPDHLHILIPKEFWIEQQIDLLRLLGDEAQNVATEAATVGAKHAPRYQGLMVNKAQVEVLWPVPLNVSRAE